MKVYILGPIDSHGDPAGNIKAFTHAEEVLGELGHRPLNPVHLATPEERAEARRLGPKFKDSVAYRAILKRGIGLLCEAEAVCALTGWQHSNGASNEHSIATALGYPIYNLDEWRERPVRAIRWTGAEEFEPRRGYEGDAAFDLYVATTTRVPVGVFRDVPCGIRIEMPPGMWGMLIGRSSTIRHLGLHVVTSVIDNGYRGDLFAAVQNLGDRPVELERGERVAQLLPFRLESTDLQLMRVEELSDSERGEKAFGSSGR